MGDAVHRSVWECEVLGGSFFGPVGGITTRCLCLKSVQTILMRFEGDGQTGPTIQRSNGGDDGDTDSPFIVWRGY